MTNYQHSAYGTNNPNAGYPANGDVAAWGGYSWPKGVPNSLIGYTNYISKTNGQTAKVPMRRELIPLWNLVFQIMDVKYHYPVWAQGPVDGKPWGPWGYENRSIAGTQIPSGHSVAVSVDINAPYNGRSGKFECDMPPAMVHDLESLFLYWGGRYTGLFDPMHFGFCRKPADVATAINKARAILGAVPLPIPTPPGGSDMDLTQKNLDDIANAVVKKLEGTVHTYTDSYAAWLGQDAYPELSYAAAAAKTFQFDSGAFRDTQILRGVTPPKK